MLQEIANRFAANIKRHSTALKMANIFTYRIRQMRIGDTVRMHNGTIAFSKHFDTTLEVSDHDLIDGIENFERNIIDPVAKHKATEIDSLASELCVETDQRLTFVSAKSFIKLPGLVATSDYGIIVSVILNNNLLSFDLLCGLDIVN